MEKKKALLAILRHGQTDYNKNHLMTGQRDVPLTEVGEEQAREAGRLLKGFSFDRVYSSTLSRAFNTAALALEHSETHIHLKNTDGTWRIDQHVDIIERHTGDFTGRNHKTDPEIISWRRIYDMPLPGGESEKQVVERVGAFFEAEIMPRLRNGENVLIVAHAGVLRAFDIVLGVADIPADKNLSGRRSVPNATPTVYEYEEGKMTHFYLLENPKQKEAANQNPPHTQDRKFK